MTLPTSDEEPVLHCDAVFLAGYAEATRDGTINALGIFDLLQARQFPAVHQRFMVCAHIIALGLPEGRMATVNVTIMDPHDQPIAHKGALVYLGVERRLPAAWAILDFKQCRFSEPGLYLVEIRVDGQRLARTALTVELEGRHGSR